MKAIRSALILTLAAWTAEAAAITPGAFAAVRVEANGVVEQTQSTFSSASLSRGYYTAGQNVSVAGIANSGFAQWSAYARASGGVSLTGGNYLTMNYRAISYATIFDNFTVSQGSFIEIPVRVTGAINTSASGTNNFPSGTQLAASVVLGMRCQVNPFDGSSYLPGTSCSDSATFTSPQSFDREILIRFPVVPNMLNTLQTTWTIDAGIGLFVNGVFTGNANFLGAAEGDFLHTGVVYPARVLDANLNVLPNVWITSGSGFDYNNPFGGGASPVPEPSIAVLLISGLGLIAASRRKQANPGRMNRK